MRHTTNSPVALPGQKVDARYYRPMLRPKNEAFRKKTEIENPENLDEIHYLMYEDQYRIRGLSRELTDRCFGIGIVTAALKWHDILEHSSLDCEIIHGEHTVSPVTEKVEHEPSQCNSSSQSTQSFRLSKRSLKCSFTCEDMHSLISGLLFFNRKGTEKP